YLITHVVPNTSSNPYSVRDVVQVGWTCSSPVACAHTNVVNNGGDVTGQDFAAYQPQTVSGTSFEDMNGNGVRDGGDPGVSGTTVWVDYNDNGVKDAGEPSTLTDSAGHYAIPNVNAGTFKVREAARAGWTCSATAGDVHGCYRTFTLSSGGMSSGNDFGSWRPASVSGSIFEDDNRNGTWDVDEGPAAGATVFIDVNGNGTLDGGEPSVVVGADGNYTIGGIPPRIAAYPVRAIMPSGWTCTAPAGCAHSVTLSSNDTAEGKNFGAVPEAQVSGTQFEDLNANGTRDAGEPVRSGWTVYVDYDNSGTRGAGEPSAVTDGSGNYTVDHVRLGTFHVREESQSGWTCPAPAGCLHVVTFAAGTSATGKDFGAWQQGSVSGTVFNDSNRNGGRDGGESGLGGWS